MFENENAAKMGSLECANHSLIAPYNVNTLGVFFKIDVFAASATLFLGLLSGFAAIRRKHMKFSDFVLYTILYSLPFQTSLH